MSEVIGTSLSDGIALLRVDQPPVNAMDKHVRAGLKRAFGGLRGNPSVKAIVLACAGRTLIAGADIKEFDTGMAEPEFHEVLRVQGNVVSPGVNELIIPNYKQTWGAIRKLADASEGVQSLSFKSLEYAT